MHMLTWRKLYHSYSHQYCWGQSQVLGCHCRLRTRIWHWHRNLGQAWPQRLSFAPGRRSRWAKPRGCRSMSGSNPKGPGWCWLRSCSVSIRYRHGILRLGEIEDGHTNGYWGVTRILKNRGGVVVGRGINRIFYFTHHFLKKKNLIFFVLSDNFCFMENYLGGGLKPP